MQLGNVWVENFMSIEEAHTDFRNRGLVLIAGINDDSDAFESNGSGKSTMFSEAPVWALYGETIRGQKADKIVNRNVGKNTRVAVEIIDDNGDLYKIERFRKHKEHKNHVRLFRNDQNITGKSDKDTDLMITELLQMDYSTFTNSIMFGQGMTKMFASSTDGEQKKILENMLQIDIYKACQEKAKEHLKTTDDQRAYLSGDILQDINSVNTTEETIRFAQEKEAKLEEQVNARIGELNEEFETYRRAHKDLDSTDELQAEKKTYEDFRAKVEDKLIGFEQYQDSLNDLISDKKSLQRDMSSLSRKQDTEREKLADIQSGKNVPKTCGACGQDLPLKDTSHVENHLKEAIKSLEMERQEKKDELQEVDNLIDKLYITLQGKKPLEEQRNSLQDTINDINTEIKVAESKRLEYVRAMEKIERQIKEQNNMLGTTYGDFIEKSIEMVNEVKERLAESQKKMTELDELYSQYEFWVNSFGNQGIKSVLLDSVTPFLNKKANHYLAKLADSSIEVAFSTQHQIKSGEKRDKFSVEVTNKNGDDEYKSNSGGEKRRIDVAVNMALQDLVLSRSNKSLDLVVFDEVFEGLDAVGSEAVIHLLEEKAKECGTVMVVTHNDSLQQLFTKSVVVKKENGSTVIIDG